MVMGTLLEKLYLLLYLVQLVFYYGNTICLLLHEKRENKNRDHCQYITLKLCKLKVKTFFVFVNVSSDEQPDTLLNKIHRYQNTHCCRKKCNW